MDPFQGVIVQVISNDETLKSYIDPHAAENGDPTTRQTYIEAATDAMFKVQILFTNALDIQHLGNEDGLRAILKVDGSDRRRSHHVTKETLKHDIRQGIPTILEFKDVPHFMHESGQWMRSAYKFSSVQMKESSNSEMSLAQAKGLGSIQITISSVRIWKRDVPKERSMQPYKTITEVSEKSLKGRDIEKSVGITTGLPIEPPKPRCYLLTTLAGPNVRKTVVFDILYRSKHTLQMMGCIPPDPPAAIVIDDDQISPAAVNRVDGARDDIQREVQDLRARLALLERGSNIKPESPSTVKTEAGRTVKREREEDETSGRRQRGRTSTHIETVVLTDD